MRTGKARSLVGLLIGSICLCAPPALAPAAEEPAAPRVRRLTVHEWGTFTSLQDEAGRTIAGINCDDEPVPPFVHTLRWDLLVGTLSQGVPRCHPDVTMRLETPVMYFHLPPSTPTPLVLDVCAEFHGGWLTQFFPHADAEAPGLSKTGVMTPGPISKNTIGTLEWNALKVGDSAAVASGPDT